MRSELSEKTLRTYESTLNSMWKKVGNAGKLPDDDGAWIERQFKDICDHIESCESPHTRKNKYAVLMVYAQLYDLKKNIRDYLTNKMDELASSINKAYETNEMNPKVEQNWVGLPEIKARIETLRSKVSGTIDTYREYVGLIKYLMLLIHCELPLRNDLADAKIYLEREMPKDLDDDVNYIVLKGYGKVLTCNIILNNYKTKKEYHQKTIAVPKHIAQEILKYYPVIKRMSPNNWFIRDRDDDDRPISRVSYTKWFQSIFADTGKSVSTTQIRRAVVSDLYKPAPGELEKKEQLASVMGHSTATAGLVYAKVEPKNEKVK